MKFSIITPTYKRADKLPRAVESVLKQSHTDWEMIIVNDSPDDATYVSFEKNISDPRVIYLKNEKNEGVNYSRNRALDSLSKDSDWVIFLDDDDYFTLDALETFSNLITANPDKKWFVTNRAYPDGKSLTSAPKNNALYSYACDYLIFKRIKGDATHCVNTKLISNIRFSRQIKQAEEWFFFYQIGLHEKIFYSSHNSTLTDGYDKSSGLNFRKHTQGEQWKSLIAIMKESWVLSIFHHPTFLVYIKLRLLRLLIL